VNGQQGGVRMVPRSQGFAWEFRFYITAPDGKRKLKAPERTGNLGCVRPLSRSLVEKVPCKIPGSAGMLLAGRRVRM
jgi:hypothetical protein